MTEAVQNESPLRSDRGSTTIKDTVVSKIAGMAAGEVEGVHMGGGASRSAGGLLEGITGSDSTTRGVSVEVGSVETAIDLKMGIDYGKNILGTVGEVRQKITERVQNITGLKVTELNVTIADVIFPDDEQDAGNGSQQGAIAGSSRTGPEFETRTMPRSELRPGAAERETTPVEPTSRTYTEGSSGPIPEEEVRAEGAPVEEDEVRWMRPGDEGTSTENTSIENTSIENTSIENTSRESASTENTSRESATTENTSTEGVSTEEGATTSESEASGDEAGPATGGTGGTGTGSTGTGSTGTTGSGDTGATRSGDERTREIDRERVSEVEERRSRRRRRRSEES